jgi:hypothetical protein
MGRRTQITLADRKYAFLRVEAERTSLAMAELIPRAVDATYRPYARRRVGGVELTVALSRLLDEALVGRRVRRRS